MTGGASGPVLVEQRGGYAILTLNRPEKRNALNKALLKAFQDALEQLRSEASVIVLTGAGDKAFTAGMDLTEAKEHLEHPGRTYAYGANLFWETLEAMRRHPAIFIAAVNGAALGGGLTLTHNADLAVAADSATFGMPEVTFGAFPGLAGPATVHRVLPKHAAWLVLTGERVDAATAQSWGIVNEVVPAADLVARAEQLAGRMAQFDPVVLDFSKKALRDLATLDWTRAVEYGLTLGPVIAQQTSSARQGIQHFVTGGRNVGQGPEQP